MVCRLVYMSSSGYADLQLQIISAKFNSILMQEGSSKYKRLPINLLIHTVITEAFRFVVRIVIA